MHLPPAANGLFALFSRRYIVAAVLTLFTLWVITSRSPDINALRNFVNVNINNDKSLYSNDKWLGSQKSFVQRAAEKGIYQEEYNGTAVRDVCRRAEWRDGLYISCDQIAGGIGNLKMRLLGCARFAIEAGGMESFQLFSLGLLLNRTVERRRLTWTFLFIREQPP